MTPAARIVLCTLISFATTPTSSAGTKPAVSVQVAFPHLRFDRPVYITHPRDGTDRLVVVEQAGRVHVFQNDPGVRRTHVALDISRRVRRQGNEEGLLGLAFHPDFKDNGYVFLHYTAARGPRRNILSRFTADPQSMTIDSVSETVLMEVKQPWANHNGGMIEFGPDGYLYIALGDGGAGGDPLNNAQNRRTLLGSILRIDPDRRDPGLAYATPTDNPFVSLSGARAEIWAYGLRNPWRFSFDRQTGDLWAGDVGQIKWEEIDLIKKGSNYGWNQFEGNHPYKKLDRPGPFEAPIFEHTRGEARSITGGYVYRGTHIPELRGHYVYADFVTGLIWCLRYDGRRVTDHHYLDRVPQPSSFGEDRDAELYITCFDGRIYKLVATAP